MSTSTMETMIMIPTIYRYLNAVALCALLFITHPASAAEDQQLTLVRDGTAESVIVFPKGKRTMTPGKMGEKSLWQVVLDFQKTLEKISGAKIPIVSPEEAPSEGTRIYIGEAVPETLRRGEDKEMDPRGYWIIAGPDALILRGKTEGGTINALYGFLQDKLGVRWFFPSDLFEVIPKQSTVSIPFGEQMFNPSFKGGMFVNSSGVNRDPELWDERMRRDIGAWRYQAPGVENLYRILDPDIYGKSHPEFYALLNGQRVVPAHNDGNAAQPCLSNPQLVEEVIKYIRQYFDETPEALMVSISENDSDLWCECDKCRAMDFPPLEKADGAVQHSDRFFAFANKVASAIAESHPGRMVGALAYLGTVTPPKNIEKLEPNIVIGLCQDHSQYYDPAYKAKDIATIEAWKKKGANFMTHDYTGLSWLVPRYDPHQYAERLRELHRQGALGVYTETYIHWPMFGPEMYLIAQLFWDVTKDPDVILDDLFYGLFGKEAGAEIKAYYETFENAWMRPNPNRKGKWFEGWSYMHEQMAVYTLDDLDRALGHLDKALKLAKDPLIKKRVEYIAHNFSYPALLMRSWLTSDQIDALVNRGGGISSAEDAARLRDMVRTVAEQLANEAHVYDTTLLVDPISSGGIYKHNWDDHFGILRSQCKVRSEYSLQHGATALLKFYNEYGKKEQIASLKKEIPEAVFKAAQEAANETLGPELIVQGDMEAPEALEAWERDGAESRLVRADEDAREGRQSLRVDPTRAYGGVLQWISVKPSTKYNYSYWYKARAQAQTLQRGFVYVSVTPETGEPNLMGNVDRMEEWTRVTGSFTVPDGCRKVALSFRGEEGKPFLMDDISVREVIEKDLMVCAEVGEGFPDWKKPTITLNTLDQVGAITGNPADKWRGAEKFNALACLGWQKDGLRLVVRVTDPEHIQQFSDSNLWRGDSIQFGITTAGTKAGRSFAKGLDPEKDFLYGLALSQTGKGKPELFAWNAPKGKPVGTIPEDGGTHTFSVKRNGTTTLYDVLISWDHLGMSPRDGRRFGFNLVVFDSFKGADGKPELVWLKLAPGIAGNEGLSPVLWKTFVIKK